MPNRWSVCAVALLAALWGGCSSATSPSTQDVAGTWVSSSICCGAAGQGDVLTASLSQSGATISGTWVSKVTINAPPNSINGGQVSGTVTGSTVAMTLTPDVAAAQCALVFNGTLSGTMQMTGTISTSPPKATCSILDPNPNITFAKQ